MRHKNGLLIEAPCVLMQLFQTRLTLCDSTYNDRRNKLWLYKTWVLKDKLPIWNGDVLVKQQKTVWTAQSQFSLIRGVGISRGWSLSAPSPSLPRQKFRSKIKNWPIFMKTVPFSILFKQNVYPIPDPSPPPSLPRQKSRSKTKNWPIFLKTVPFSILFKQNVYPIPDPPTPAVLSATTFVFVRPRMKCMSSMSPCSYTCAITYKDLFRILHRDWENKQLELTSATGVRVYIGYYRRQN